MLHSCIHNFLAEKRGSCELGISTLPWRWEFCPGNWNFAKAAPSIMAVGFEPSQGQATETERSLKAALRDCQAGAASALPWSLLQKEGITPATYTGTPTTGSAAFPRGSPWRPACRCSKHPRGQQWPLWVGGRSWGNSDWCPLPQWPPNAAWPRTQALPVTAALKRGVKPTQVVKEGTSWAFCGS